MDPYLPPLARGCEVLGARTYDGLVNSERFISAKYCEIRVLSRCLEPFSLSNTQLGIWAVQGSPRSGVYETYERSEARRAFVDASDIFVARRQLVRLEKMDDLGVSDDAWLKKESDVVDNG